MSSLSVGDNTRVTLHFSLALGSGAVVDDNFDAKPAVFEFGDGQLPEGFQSLLTGMHEGEEGEWQVPPEKAFGMPNPNNVQEFKRSVFAPDMELAEGLVVSFQDASKSELPGVIKHFDDEQVSVDFNHPLAGETLTFKARIIQVEAL